MQGPNGDLPTYEVLIDESADDETGIYRISLVDKPAIGVDFVVMNKQIQKVLYADPEKRILVGPLLIPDKLIYRVDPNGNECYHTWNIQTIQNASRKFAKSLYNNQLNLMHDNIPVKGTLVESWLIDDSLGKGSPDLEGMTDLPQGTWMGVVKIDDARFWNAWVKSGGVKGFSIEAAINTQLISYSKNIKTNMSTKKTKQNSGKRTQLEDKMLNGKPGASYKPLAQAKQTKGKAKMKKVKMNKNQNIGIKLLQMLGFMETKMSEVVKMSYYTLDDGTTIYVDDNTGEAFMVNEKGEIEGPCPDGKYTSGDMTVEVINGVAEIESSADEPAEGPNTTGLEEDEEDEEDEMEEDEEDEEVPTSGMPFGTSGTPTSQDEDEEDEEMEEDEEDEEDDQIKYAKQVKAILTKLAESDYNPESIGDAVNAIKKMQGNPKSTNKGDKVLNPIKNKKVNMSKLEKLQKENARLTKIVEMKQIEDKKNADKIQLKDLNPDGFNVEFISMRESTLMNKQSKSVQDVLAQRDEFKKKGIKSEKKFDF